MNPSSDMFSKINYTEQVDAANILLMLKHSRNKVSQEIQDVVNSLLALNQRDMSVNATAYVLISLK